MDPSLPYIQFPRKHLKTKADSSKLFVFLAPENNPTASDFSNKCRNGSERAVYLSLPLGFLVKPIFPGWDKVDSHLQVATVVKGQGELAIRDV